MNTDPQGKIVFYTGTDVTINTLTKDILVKTDAVMNKEKMYLRAAFTNKLANYFSPIDIPLALIVYKLDPFVILLQGGKVMIEFDSDNSKTLQ